MCLYTHMQDSKQSLLKVLDTLLTDVENIPQWLGRFLKRAFVVTVFTIMTVVLRVSVGAPNKDIFHK